MTGRPVDPEGRDLGVLLAVGAGGVADGALGLACREAVRRGVPVTLLHVVHSIVPVPPAPIDGHQTVDAALTEVGRGVLTDAADRARAAGATEVGIELRFGPVSATIAELSGRAELTVLERRDADRIERLLTHSVSSDVAAHGRGAVAVVPADWTPAEGEPKPVVVGIDSPADAGTMAAGALELAAGTTHRLEVLHSAYVAPPYESVVLVSYPRHQWLADTDAELARGLDKLASTESADDVELTHAVRWALPVEALVDASADASALVLHRRDGERWGVHLGGVTRAVLRHAECPVWVMDRA